MTRVDKLSQELKRLSKTLDLPGKARRLEILRTETGKDSFWKQSEANQLIREKNDLEALIGGWTALETELEHLKQLAGDGSGLEIDSLADEFGQKLKKYDREYASKSPYDSHNVIVSIYAGAGGVDAQDWSEMLLRMYTRWAESKKLKFELISISKGDEAGLKSVSFYLRGKLSLYGLLRNESGVHRLVRLSPFNARNLRQTSFAKVEVIPEISQSESFDIPETDLRFDFFRSSGHGGQSVNTTDSAVRVTHLPTNLVVTIQNERSQLRNKETALNILRSRLVQLKTSQHAQKISDLKGDKVSNEWGSQIRNYILHPYKQVKDLRSKQTSSDPKQVLDGDIDQFLK